MSVVEKVKQVLGWCPNAPQMNVEPKMTIENRMRMG